MAAEVAYTAPVAVTARSLRDVVSDYVQISKPRILLLLLFVAWAAMFTAAGDWPDWVAFAAVTGAGTFSVAASGAFNNVLERSRDRRMGRTSQRAVAAGRITVPAALVYASVMAALSVAIPAAVGLWWAAGLTAGAILYYVLVYTVLLKPATPQNIVIGGFAGSFPALIGWAAQTGSLALPAAAPALLLALLVFLWTPPHFWSLALVYRDDYEAAGYPMMPNVRGEASTRRQILVYTLLTVAVSLLLPFLGTAAAGWPYLAVAALAGGVLVVRAVRLQRSSDKARDRAFFFLTIQYLGLVLVALMADRLLAAAGWLALGP